MSVGRPPKYVGRVKRHIITLIKRHNAATAQKILNAGPKDSLVELRSLKIVPKALGISLPTLNTFAAAAEVTHAVGRPRKAA